MYATSIKSDHDGADEALPRLETVMQVTGHREALRAAYTAWLRDFFASGSEPVAITAEWLAEMRKKVEDWRNDKTFSAGLHRTIVLLARFLANLEEIVVEGGCGATLTPLFESNDIEWRTPVNMRLALDLGPSFARIDAIAAQTGAVTQ